MSPDDRTRGSLSVLVIDDDADHSDLIEQLLTEHAARQFPEGLSVSVFSDPVEALANVPLGPTVVLCDYCLGGSCALDWLADFIRADCGPVILLTSSGSEKIAASAFRQGASDYIVKSDFFAQPELLFRSIKETMRRYRLERRNTELSRSLKQVNAELQEKNHTLAELTETAHRFVDDVAHEFRTPLAVIQEFASIISDGIGGPLTPRQSEFLVHIDHATRDLAGLVDDFLDTSRLRAQTLRVDRAERSVVDLFAGVRAALTLRAGGKQIRIIERIEPGLAPVFIDIEKAQRVITNLTINAIKFSPAGSEVVISARALGTTDIEIAVTDAGPGISPQDIAAIFQRFVQTDRTRRPGVKGFGLGLSIAQELVSLNLGKLDVRSELGKSTTFSFTIPVYNPAAVIGKHLEQICADQREGFVTLVRAYLGEEHLSLEEMRQELVAVCHPWDLVLPEPETRSLLLLGPTGEPENWVSRIERNLVAARDHGHESRALLRFSILGCWSPRQALTAVPQRVLADPGVLIDAGPDELRPASPRGVHALPPVVSPRPVAYTMGVTRPRPPRADTLPAGEAGEVGHAA